MSRADGLPEPQPAVTIPTVDVAGVWDNPSPEPDFVWAKHIPRGHVCLLSGHGGSGKSTAALQLCVAVAIGLPLWGIPTTQGPVVFFSGEDAGPILRHRLAAICHDLNVDPHLLAQHLLALDATSEPVLYRELAEFGRHTLEPSPVFHRLAEILTEHQPVLCVVDNASDAYEANENDRAQVRAFVRGLASLGRQGSNPAIVLLTHTPKASVRGGGESYSGSTAWHNSARARLSLAPDGDDTSRVVLTLDKLNLAPMTAEPLRLTRTMGGVLVLDESTHDATGEPTEPPQTALLRVLGDFNRRGEHVSSEQSAHTNAWKLCRPEPGFPKRAFQVAGALFAALRQMERDGLIEKGTYRDRYRKERPEWLLTAKGWDAIGESAPSAPSAPSYDENAEDAVSLGSAPSAPSYGVGGMGGFLAHDEDANLPDSPMAEKTPCPRCDGEGCEFCQPEEASQ
ncbi:AAA family ATPase [Acidithiobacillus sulfurivorans]|uniref:AAA family ATPase n=1 Tax=Acidithiobacillus sulfurivorans TaxID=1958756 RepID=A0ABS5ZWN7_9PROT|nr:AAA family ATPase [Acidithiobacillus sulfurivorans]MBU2759522.1 AAA family ATPase [Acidithiobacillus sulfurivorans]